MKLRERDVFIAMWSSSNTMLYCVVICVMEIEGENDEMSVYLSGLFQLHITEIHPSRPTPKNVVSGC